MIGKDILLYMKVTTENDLRERGLEIDSFKIGSYRWLQIVNDSRGDGSEKDGRKVYLDSGQR